MHSAGSSRPNCLLLSLCSSVLFLLCVVWSFRSYLYIPSPFIHKIHYAAVVRIYQFLTDESLVEPWFHEWNWVYIVHCVNLRSVFIMSKLTWFHNVSGSYSWIENKKESKWMSLELVSVFRWITIFILPIFELLGVIPCNFNKMQKSSYHFLGTIAHENLISGWMDTSFEQSQKWSCWALWLLEFVYIFCYRAMPI